MLRSDNTWLMARPACPPPMMSVLMRIMIAPPFLEDGPLSADRLPVHRNVHGTTVGQHIEHRGTIPRTLDDLPQHVFRSIASDLEVDADRLISVTNRWVQPEC